MPKRSMRKLSVTVAGVVAAAVALLRVASAQSASAFPGSAPGDTTVFSDPSTATSGAIYTRAITLRHNGSHNGRILGTFES